jgi:hypothetical protein
MLEFMEAEVLDYRRITILRHKARAWSDSEKRPAYYIVGGSSRTRISKK